MYSELYLLDWIQMHLRCDFLDTVMPYLTALGNGGILWILCAALLLLLPQTRKAGAAMAVALALEALCCNIVLKPLAARIRPFDVNTAVQLLIPAPTDYSFPSGHTGAAFSAASALFFEKRRGWVLAFLSLA